MDLSNIPDIGSRQLLAVLAIADYGSFIAAAAFLKTSQPALTRTIKRIEDVLGVSLFERTTRRVQLCSWWDLSTCRARNNGCAVPSIFESMGVIRTERRVERVHKVAPDGYGRGRRGRRCVAQVQGATTAAN